MDKSESLKFLLSSISGLSDKISKMKESLVASAADELAQGGNVDNLTDEQKAEAAKIEEAKAKELADAAAKKAAIDAEDVKDGGKDEDTEDKKKAKAALEAEEVAKAEADKKAVEEAAAKSLADATAKEKELADAKAAEELAIAEAAIKAKAEKMDKFKKAMCSAEEATDLGFEASEAELATKYSFVELVKVLASISKEAVSLKEEKAKAEASKIADSRYRELVDLGVAFNGKKGEGQKANVEKMDEKAFASYKALALEMKEAVDSDEGLTATAVAKAKASLGNVAAAPKLDSEDLADKYTKL